jgi:phosphoadenosine phosphosulfate reductase
MQLPPLEAIKGAAQMFDTCLVSFSGGKDSIAAFDLCRKHFKEVRGLFYYTVPNLEYQEKTLRGYEARWDTEFFRLPDPWTLPRLLREGWCRPKTDLSAECPEPQRKDCESYVRKCDGWTAYGSRALDSFVRRGYIYGRNRRCVELKQRSFYPIGAWTTKQVFAYMRMNRLYLPTDYRITSNNTSGTGQSFGTMVTEHLVAIKERFPDDYARIKYYFPFIEADVMRDELVRRYVKDKQIPEVQSSTNPQVEAKERALQPA